MTIGWEFWYVVGALVLAAGLAYGIVRATHMSMMRRRRAEEATKRIYEDESAEDKARD